MSNKGGKIRDIFLGNGAMAYTAAAAMEFEAARQIVGRVLDDCKEGIDDSGHDMMQKRHLVMSALSEKPSFQALRDLYNATESFLDALEDDTDNDNAPATGDVYVAYGTVNVLNAMLSAFVDNSFGPKVNYIPMLQLLAQFIRNSSGDETVEILNRASTVSRDIAGFAGSNRGSGTDD